MNVTGISIKILKRGLDITIQTTGGDYTFHFSRQMAWRLSRALFGSIGTPLRKGGLDHEKGAP